MARRMGLDVLKGACILLVVFNHALLWPMRAGDRLSAFAYGIAFGSVAAFSAVAGYVQGLHPPSDEQALIRKRAGQLLVPWAIWAPVYAVAPLLWGLVGGGPLPMEFRPGPWATEIMLGGGPLWFLPVLFAATAICAVLDTRTTSWWPGIVGLMAYAALAAASFGSNTSPLDLGNGTFWAVAPLYVSALWFGLRVSRDGRPRVTRSSLIATVAVTMIAGGVVTLDRAVNPELRWLMWLPYGIGLFGGCAALLLATGDSKGSEIPLARTGARIGQASLGIYILHPLLVGPVVLVAHGTGGMWAALLATVLTAAVGVPLVERLRKLRLGRFVV
ncbi:MAG: acyltransferase [Actinobacteria bacterium]|nr:acyltransferase [Actinomycetota bacterium]